MGDQTGSEVLCKYAHPWFVCTAGKSKESQKLCKGFTLNRNQDACTYRKEVDVDVQNCTHFGLQKEVKL